MFSWIWKAGLTYWGIFNYWSIVPIVIIMIFAAIFWKSVITPKEYQERLAWEQQRENDKLTQARINRLGTIGLKWGVLFMGSVFFCIAIIKMFSD